MNTTATAAAGKIAPANERTLRRDTWWLQPLLTVIGLGGFAIYATWVAFQNANYLVEPYLSPFYSPLIKVSWWSFSPAFLVLWAPLGFRATCYYYRKAYYRSFFWDPPACAIGEVWKGTYHGETRFPFILQNLHRYFFYAAVVVLAFLWYDTIKAFIFDGRFGIRIGSLLYLVNIILLSAYTFSCHSFRHLIGGQLDCYSCSASAGARHSLWEKVSLLNHRHMLWAWLSLFSVGLTDLYVRLLATGVVRDRIIF